MRLRIRRWVPRSPAVGVPPARPLHRRNPDPPPPVPLAQVAAFGAGEDERIDLHVLRSLRALCRCRADPGRPGGTGPRGRAPLSSRAVMSASSSATVRGADLADVLARQLHDRALSDQPLGRGRVQHGADRLEHIVDGAVGSPGRIPDAAVRPAACASSHDGEHKTCNYSSDQTAFARDRRSSARAETSS